jgi:hypothetical protein
MTPRDFNRGALKYFFERKMVVERQCAVAADMSLKIKTPVGPSNSEWSMRDIGTPVESLTYNFVRHIGQLYLPEGCCCDMDGCIELFQKIDKNVRRIDTFSGMESDTIYIRNGTNWFATSLNGISYYD